MEWIFSRAFNLSSFDKASKIVHFRQYTERAGKLITSGVEVSHKNDKDVLLYFENVPVALIDIPTINGIIFTKELWKRVLDDDLTKIMLESLSYWGEIKHQQSDEVDMEKVSIRTDGMWMHGDYLLANVALLNTICGNIIFRLISNGKSRFGVSTRGFGELQPLKSGLSLIKPESYNQVCIDSVSLPACPQATLSNNNTTFRDLKSVMSVDRELKKLAKEERVPAPSKDKSFSNGIDVTGLLGLASGAKPIASVVYPKAASEPAKELDPKQVLDVMKKHRARFYLNKNTPRTAPIQYKTGDIK